MRILHLAEDRVFELRDRGRGERQREPETFELYGCLQEDGRVRVVTWTPDLLAPDAPTEHGFNYSLFEDIGGYDERLAVGYNDGDYGLSARPAASRTVLHHQQAPGVLLHSGSRSELQFQPG